MPWNMHVEYAAYTHLEWWPDAMKPAVGLPGPSRHNTWTLSAVVVAWEVTFRLSCIMLDVRGSDGFGVD